MEIWLESLTQLFPLPHRTSLSPQATASFKMKFSASLLSLLVVTLGLSVQASVIKPSLGDYSLIAREVEAYTRNGGSCDSSPQCLSRNCHYGKCSKKFGTGKACYKVST